MDDVSDLFENLKISAFSKVQKVNSYVTNTTIGPNRTLTTIEDESEVNHSNLTLRKSTAKTDLRDYLNKKHLNERKIIERPNESPPALIIKDLRNVIERKRQNKLQNDIQNRVSCILNFSREQHIERLSFLEQQRQTLLNEFVQQENLIQQTVEEHDTNVKLNNSRLLQDYQQATERVKRKNQELREQEKHRQEIHQIIDLIKKNQSEFRVIYQEIITLIKWCKTENKLSAEIAETVKSMKGLPESMEEVISNCKPGKITKNDSDKTSQLVDELRGIKERIKKLIADLVAQEEANNEEKKRQLQEQQQIKPQTSLRSLKSIKQATELQNFLEEHTQSCHELMNSSALKQFRFDCKKAVNIPVNALSGVSSQHLIDKYQKLSALLAGQGVVVGNSRFNPSQHPQGVAFCTQLLANKFVLQGDLLISSNPEAAFYYSTIIVSLWSQNEIFGKLILANFHKECPYLIPFYPPKLQNQTNEDYYRSRGYHFATDGVVEKQDKFLKRMSGTMQLYCAILVARTKTGLPENPHGLKEAWRWAGAFLNLPPQADISATMLDVFLDVTGSMMLATYGKVFRKLMRLICEKYFPMLQKIDSGGPVTRLKSTLDEYQRTGRFPPPKGMLTPNFW